MNFRELLRYPANLFKRKDKPLKEVPATVAFAYSFLLTLAETPVSTSQIVQLILQNPWTTTSKPGIRFITAKEGDLQAEITFYVLKKEKGLAIENEIRSAVNKHSA